MRTDRLTDRHYEANIRLFAILRTRLKIDTSPILTSPMFTVIYCDFAQHISASLRHLQGNLNKKITGRKDICKTRHLSSEQYLIIYR